MNKEISVNGSNYELGLILHVGETEFRLNGRYFENKFSVLYKEEIEKAIDLGTVADGLVTLGNVLVGAGKGRDFYNSIHDFINELPAILEKVMNAFLNAHIVITRLEITNGEGNEMKYAVGLGLLFREKVSIYGIALEYFTFEYEGTSGSKALMNSFQGSPQD